MRLLFSFSTLHRGGFYAWEWGRGEPIYDRDICTAPKVIHLQVLGWRQGSIQQAYESFAALGIVA